MSVRSSLLTLFLVLVAVPGCRTAAPPAATASPAAQDPALTALRPLDARHAAAFRRTFDDLAGHDRYIVALSPT